MDKGINYKLIGKIAVGLIIAIIVVHGYLTFNSSTTAYPTGTYHIENKLDDSFWDIYFVFDSTDKENTLFSIYYFYFYNDMDPSENVPSAYAKMSGKFAAYEINRLIGPICYNSIENNYSIQPMFKKAIHMYLYDIAFKGFDMWGDSIQPDDMNIDLSEGEDILLFDDNEMLWSNQHFEKVATIPDEYAYLLGELE